MKTPQTSLLREKYPPMNTTADVLVQRLKETTYAFYEWHLRCRPREVEVLREQDFVVIRVRGFLTKAESELIKRPAEAMLLSDYYNGMLVGLYVLLEEVLKDTEQLALVDKRVVLEFDQEQCVFLLTLGPKSRWGGKGREPFSQVSQPLRGTLLYTLVPVANREKGQKSSEEEKRHEYVGHAGSAHQQTPA